MKLFLSPHNDDETLFGAFTIQREKPLVVVVFDSYVQAIRGNDVTWGQRRLETERALETLVPDSADWRFLGLRDDVNQPSITAIAHLVEQLGDFEHVYAPAIELNGHAHHDIVGRVADWIWSPGRVTHYLTYTRDKGKSTSAHRVPVESGEWTRRKLRALACYESQIDIERLGCRPHFMNDLWEYYE